MGIVIVLVFIAYLLCGWLTLKLFYAETTPEMRLDPTEHSSIETFIFCFWWMFLFLWTVKKLIISARKQ
jgi:hypothetical protein